MPRSSGISRSRPTIPARAQPLIPITKFIDARLPARFETGCPTAPGAANQAINITNASSFRWCDLRSVLADYFSARHGIVMPFSLHDIMADKAPVWYQIVSEHGLAPTPFSEMAAGHSLTGISDVPGTRFWRTPNGSDMGSPT